MPAARFDPAGTRAASSGSGPHSKSGAARAAADRDRRAVSLGEFLGAMTASKPEKAVARTKLDGGDDAAMGTRMRLHH